MSEAAHALQVLRGPWRLAPSAIDLPPTVANHEDRMAQLHGELVDFALVQVLLDTAASRPPMPFVSTLLARLDALEQRLASMDDHGGM